MYVACRAGYYANPGQENHEQGQEGLYMFKLGSEDLALFEKYGVEDNEDERELKLLQYIE